MNLSGILGVSVRGDILNPQKTMSGRHFLFKAPFPLGWEEEEACSCSCSGPSIHLYMDLYTGALPAFDVQPES